MGKFIGDNQNGFQELVITGAYYSSIHRDGIIEWAINEENEDGIKEVEKRLGDFTEYFRRICSRDTGVREGYDLIGGIYNILRGHRFKEPSAEDFQFYCGEYLRGLEAAIKMGKDVEDLVGVPGMEKIIWEWIEDVICY